MELNFALKFLMVTGDQRKIKELRKALSTDS